MSESKRLTAFIDLARTHEHRNQAAARQLDSPAYPLDPFFRDPSLAAPDELSDRIQMDQQMRWRDGAHFKVEDYVRRFPQLAADDELLLDLIYQEFLLSEYYGSHPKVEEFAERFPTVASGIQRQVALRDAIDREAATFDTHSVAQRDEDDREDSTFPNHIGRYSILRPLGSGGMGQVYLARDTELHRDVAIKLPTFHSEGAATDNERFYREARSLAALRHPNICPIYDFGLCGQQAFLVMPVLEGQTMDQLMRTRRQLPCDEAISLCVQIGAALECAHDRGLIHRDLKPGNIMIDECGQAIIFDFGLVGQSRTVDPRLTSSGLVAGTPAYLAPERLRDLDMPPSAAADIYSLGVVFYEMLAGQLPHGGTSAAQLLARALTETAPPLSEFRPDIPREVEAACMRAIDKDASLRFASITEFVTALQTHRQNGVESPNTHTSANADRDSNARLAGIGRNKAIALATLLISVLVGLGWLFQKNVVSTPSTEAMLRADEQWVGTFQFDAGDAVGDVQMRITSVAGSEFRGEYRTEEGKYAWTIRGRMDDDEIEFDFEQGITSATESEDVVGNAQVIGRITGDTFRGVFRDRSDDSSANLKLERQP